MAKAKKKPPTKTEIMSSIADATGLSKKDVALVFDALSDEIKKAMGSRGAGMFSLPGLLKIEKKKVPARPAQKNWLNPFTKELQDRPAKPASVKIKVRPLKNLKEMV
jgi:nucleoid DNA-binding protein